MKKSLAMLIGIFMLAFCMQTFAADGPEVNEKVIRSFKLTFPDAEKVSWQEFAERYVVHFEEGDIQTVMDFDKEGNYLVSKRYYKEDKLPVNILCKLRKKYADKKISIVTEVSTENNTDYYIKLEDATTWMTVKSDGGGSMEVVDKYKKV